MGQETLTILEDIDGTFPPVQLQAGKRWRIVLKRRPLERLEQTHFRYANNSAIAVPGPWNDWKHPAEALAAAALKLHEHPELAMVLCGHASPPGTDIHNRELSTGRARAIAAMITADREEWVAIATRCGSLEDIKAFLHYLSERRGWPCAPGTVDAEVNEVAEAGIGAFQQAFNERFNANIDVHGRCTKPTLGAVFDVLQFELDAWLEKLSLTRADLRLSEEHVFGVGSAKGAMVDESEDDEARGRLVDVVFVRPQAFKGEVSPELLYTKARQFVNVPIPHDPGDWEYGSLLVVTDLHPEDSSLDERYRLSAADGGYSVELSVAEHGHVRNGGIEIEFRDVPTQSKYSLVVTSREGRESSVFTDIPYSDFHRLSTSFDSAPPES